MYLSKLTLAEQIFSFMRDEISSAERLDESSKMFIEHLLHQEIKRFSNKQVDIQRLSDKALIKFEYFVESLLYDLDQLSKLPQHFSTADVSKQIFLHADIKSHMAKQHNSSPFTTHHFTHH